MFAFVLMVDLAVIRPDCVVGFSGKWVEMWPDLKGLEFIEN
jgi:hypothetical protein